MGWQLRSNGDFIVRSFYGTLWGSSSMSLPWKAIGRVKAPHSVSFFVWTTTWGKILTCDNLIRGAYAMVSWCCVLMQWGDGGPPFYNCDVPFDLWCYVFWMFGIRWVLLEKIHD